MECRPMKIKMLLFPADSIEVEPLLDELEAQELILRYTVDGEKLLWIPRFTKHQKPHKNEMDKPSIYPPHPTDTNQQQDGTAPDKNGSGTENIGTSREENGTKTLLILDPESLILNPESKIPDKNKRSPHNPPKGKGSVVMHHCGLPLQQVWRAAFEDLWEIYPKKQGKKPAQKAWNKLNGDEELYHKILAAVDAWSLTEDWQKNDGQYVPLASTFLNQHRWEDEIPAPKPVNRADPKWMAENDDYTAIGGTKSISEAEYDALAKRLGWDQEGWDED
jgi:hypothetical protein